VVKNSSLEFGLDHRPVVAEALWFLNEATYLKFRNKDIRTGASTSGQSSPN